MNKNSTYHNRSIILTFAYFLISFCVYSQNNTEIINEGMGTEAIKVGDTKKHIINNFGGGDACEGWEGKVIKNETEGIVKDTRKKTKKKWKNLKCYEKLGVQVLFKKGKVNSVYFVSPNYITSKGIMIGKSRTDVLKIYGGDYDSKRVVYYQLGIGFLFENDIVVEIQILKPQVSK